MEDNEPTGGVFDSPTPDEIFKDFADSAKSSSEGVKDEATDQTPEQTNTEPTPESPAISLDTEVEVDGKRLKLSEFIQSQTDERIKGFQREYTKKSQDLAAQRRDLEEKEKLTSGLNPQERQQVNAMRALLKGVATEEEGQKLINKFLPVVEEHLGDLSGPAPQPRGEPQQAPQPQVDPRVERLLVKQELDELESRHVALTPEQRDGLLETWAALEEQAKTRIPAEVAYKVFVADKLLPKLKEQNTRLKKERVQRGRAATVAPSGAAGITVPKPKKPEDQMTEDEFLDHVKNDLWLRGRK